MKRCIPFLIISCVLLSLLILPSLAVGTINLSGYADILSWVLNEDNDDPFTDVYIQFSPYGSLNWSTLESYDSSSMEMSSYILPSSLVKQGNRFRIYAITDTNSYAYSNVYTISESYFADFSIWYDIDNSTFHLAPSSNIITLHFTPETYVYGDITTPQPWTVTVPSACSSYYYDYIFYKILNQTYTRDYNSTVYATTVVDGVTYTSNTITLLGAPFLAPVTADTEIVDPSANDVNNIVDLTYSGITRTPAYKYVFSGLFAITPFILCGYVIKHFVA